MSSGEKIDDATLFENETVLPDDYPVYGDYLYVADGTVVRSDVFGTVRDLKRSTKATEIRRCNIAARREALKAEAQS